MRFKSDYLFALGLIAIAGGLAFVRWSKATTCYTTHDEGVCGVSGQGPEIPCKQSPCYEWKSWTAGRLTSCKNVTAGLRDCAVVEKGCSYYFAQYVCKNDECQVVPGSDINEVYMTSKAHGADCNEPQPQE